MRYLLMIALLLLPACTEATASRIDNRTFRVEGPGTPGGSTAPNRRLARKICPRGYRVLNQEVSRNSPDGYSEEPGIFTNWTIRCI
ncbi:MAG TPA: hypothetical protein VFX06_04135 [Stellaceae bacterium]|nr:hypothetical protein [Stellaceae bacterium]